MKNILIVEDEEYMLNLLKIHLSDEYNITEAKDGQIALDYIENQVFDLVVLDIMLPHVDGWTVCERILKKGDTPIIMLTARSELYDKVKGLELGADDYLIKPFEFEELKARIKALLRRYDHIQKRDESNNQIKFLSGRFLIDNESRQLTVNNQLVELTAKEFSLLALLASQPQRVFTREILLDNIWEMYESRDLRTVDTHVKNVRIKLKKVEKEMNFIKTVWGIGYKLNIQEDIQ
ncbi:DNA-binding response regulator [Priestia aryabhattai]|jgi:DNA-binding response OmpR family regulator|uniref:Two-component system response regulator n=2 Tax=Priestia TaxID=2800373 RepID=A0A0V8JGY0_9BACI|nr:MULTISPECIES: response regulator transcription factor [Priestia]OZT11097.1 DNA-binding response regulator [Priestia aryabhattai]KSU86291.1 two-component system response regulator [Priestia veravalensis]MBN8253907.1 response regulator transcription factor [Priestia flexa]MBY6088471.1 response regulator transcription factor [Priestia flexa]MCA1203945.1 response regulator transcription factor [Priestia flexa]